jgi:hypothetical protein
MLQIVLLAGKIIFLIILYLFLYRVIRSATRELRAAAPGPAKQSYPATPVAMAALGPPVSPSGIPAAGGTWSLVVEKSSVLRPGDAFNLAPGAPALAGRSSDMDIYLDDTFVSSKHVLFEATPSGVLAEDLLSTNGTQVNGTDISQPTLLLPGDRVEVGDTIFRVEVR